jgi:tRNA(Ile)-lysidine synthase
MMRRLSHEDLPPGRWCIGVSGGADSVALLRLLHARGDLQLHVAHLDHQLRGDDSTGDARFVAALCTSMGIPATIALRSDIESALPDPPANPSARYRAARLELFRRVVREHHLGGIALAHHADDQAETILQRLIRGSSIEGLCGMRPCTTIGDLPVYRPLLSIRRQTLRDYLTGIRQPWREDASNASRHYLRNRLRQLLAGRPELIDGLLRVARAAQSVRQWVSDVTPALATATADMPIAQLTALPEPISRELARRWLIGVGAAEASLDGRSIGRLLEMATDAASPGRQDFPGGIRIARRSGRLRRVQLAGI